MAINSGHLECKRGCGFFASLQGSFLSCHFFTTVFQPSNTRAQLTDNSAKKKKRKQGNGSSIFGPAAAAAAVAAATATTTAAASSSNHTRGGGGCWLSAQSQQRCHHLQPLRKGDLVMEVIEWWKRRERPTDTASKGTNVVVSLASSLGLGFGSGLRFIVVLTFIKEGTYKRIYYPARNLMPKEGQY